MVDRVGGASCAAYILDGAEYKDKHNRQPCI